jgi:hypothetical protein
MKDELNMDGRNLDEELNSAAQVQIRETVRALPEEPLSLAWRSDLNTQLRGVAARKRKLDLFGWVWKPAAGGALACALAFAFLIRPGGSMSEVPSNGIEKALVGHYVDTTASWEVAGDGVTVNEVKEATAAHPVPTDLDQEDVGAIL